MTWLEPRLALDGAPTVRYKNERFHQTRYLLHGELGVSNRNAIDELQSWPEPVELRALVHVHDAVGGRRPHPDGVVQEAAQPGQHHLEDGQAAAQPLPRQQVSLARDHRLLRTNATDDNRYANDDNQHSSKAAERDQKRGYARHIYSGIVNFFPPFVALCTR